MFICCNDFDFKTIFGNALTEGIEGVWNGDKRKSAISHAYSDMCTRCSAAIWG